MKVSDRVHSIAASQSLAMAARARAMKAAGIDVISMSLGEPDMETPIHIRQAAQEAVADGWSHYGPVAGIPSLRAAIARQQNNVVGNRIAWEADDVMVSVGAKMAIYNAIQTAINSGDEVIIPMPSWVSYSEMVKLAGGKVVAVDTKFEDDYCMTPEQLRAALSDKTRMLILCSPNNPTGSIYNREKLEALVAILRDYPEVCVLSDEIYASLSYDISPLSMAAFEPLSDRLIIVNGVSKAYAMTGYRIGWLMTKNRPFINACIHLQGQQLTCATMVAQKAAEAALTGPQTCVEQMRKVFEERRDLICRLAAEIPGWKFKKPQGAFYLFPDVSAIGYGNAVAEMLLEKAHVAVVPGVAFGCPECIRLSYAISTEEIKEAMRRIKELGN
ncbi:MAG: pyridoxal phosphate-dependent aminotransferase [Paludibacteraceae bacterium]|nr:pyridoxal phosphate-dependent aminotransferase [Paludibacteraceae bacterium]